MKLAPFLVTPPDDTDPIVTLAEAKAHLRVDNDDDDAYIEGLVGAAVSYLDGYTGILGRCLVSQEWRVALDCWPSDGIIRLPFPNCAPTAVLYADANDDDQTLDQALWQDLADARGHFIYLKKAFTGPTLNDDRPDPIRVEFTAGYGSADQVPKAIKHAILLMIGSLYENREDVVVGQSLFVAAMPFGVEALLAPFRRVGV